MAPVAAAVFLVKQCFTIYKLYPLVYIPLVVNFQYGVEYVEEINASSRASAEPE